MPELEILPFKASEGKAEGKSMEPQASKMLRRKVSNNRIKVSNLVNDRYRIYLE